jgi:hypothetical protein
LQPITAQSDPATEIQPFQLAQIKQSFDTYKIALLAELGALDSYFVTQKGSHETLSLLSFGENLFPIDMARKVPEAIFDARQAGKCLAFEVPTACGFHVFRVLESILRRYHAHVTGGAAPPKVRNIGVYLNALKQAGHGDPKVLAALKQMTDLHRNPLIHPEAVLTTEEALAILGIVRSAAAAMLAVLPELPQTTATAGIQSAP